MTLPKILLLGDSLTQTSFEGWGGGLANIYQRRADVINRGCSGYNTRWYLKFAEKYGVWKEPGNVVLVLIFFGANDASILEHNPHAHVPLEEYQTNLTELIGLARQNYPDARLMILTPPPVHHGQRLAFQIQRFGKEKATGVLERTLENTGTYAAACRSVAESEGVPCVDLYNSMQDVVKDEGTEEDPAFGKYFYDGLHFSAEGHTRVLKELLVTIQNELPDMHVTQDRFTGQYNNSGSSCPGLSSLGPYHDSIHHDSWELAFQDDSAIN